MDEAVLRIVMKDEAQGATPTSTAGQSAPPPPPPPQQDTTPATGGGFQSLFKSLFGAVQSGMQGDFSGAAQHIAGEGGAMETMGVSGESIATALPPVAIAVAAKQMGEKINLAIIDGLKQEISKVGDIATSIAQVNQDVSVPMKQLGEATSKAGEKIDEYVPYVGKAIMVTGEVVKALAGLVQAVDSTAKHYEQYNVDIAMASAQAEVRQTTRDLARAQLLGGNLSSFVTAKSKLENDVEDIKARLLDVLLPTITMMVRMLDMVVTGVEKSADAMLIVADIAREGPKLFVNAEKQREIMERIHNLMEKRDQDEGIEDPTTVLFKQNNWLMTDPQQSVGGR